MYELEFLEEVPETIEEEALSKHDRYNHSEKGRARWRKYRRSPKATATRAAYKLRQLGAS